jgi:hypothetical protein
MYAREKSQITLLEVYWDISKYGRRYPIYSYHISRYPNILQQLYYLIILHTLYMSKHLFIICDTQLS